MEARLGWGLQAVPECTPTISTSSGACPAEGQTVQ